MCHQNVSQNFIFHWTPTHSFSFSISGFFSSLYSFFVFLFSFKSFYKDKLSNLLSSSLSFTVLCIFILFTFSNLAYLDFSFSGVLFCSVLFCYGKNYGYGKNFGQNSLTLFKNLVKSIQQKFKSAKKVSAHY